MSIGVIHQIKFAIEDAEAAIGDKLLGIKTLGCGDVIQPTGAIYGDSTQYRSKCYSLIWQYLHPLQFCTDDVFYDVGCGTGRVLCVVAQRRIRKCVGIELSHELSELARQNAARLRRRRTAIEIVEGDAALADYSEGTIYSFFNPFGGRTLRAVLDRIHEDVRRRPRRLRFLYINPVAAEVFDKTAWLHQVNQRSFIGSPLIASYYETH